MLHYIIGKLGSRIWEINRKNVIISYRFVLYLFIFHFCKTHSLYIQYTARRTIALQEIKRILWFFGENEKCAFVLYDVLVHLTYNDFIDYILFILHNEILYKYMIFHTFFIWANLKLQRTKLYATSCCFHHCRRTLTLSSLTSRYSKQYDAHFILLFSTVNYYTLYVFLSIPNISVGTSGLYIYTFVKHILYGISEGSVEL